MPARRKIPEDIQTQVRQRANYLCEYCADGLLIIGLAPIGRSTVATLVLNRERVINIRAADKAVGRHPPVGDPIQPEN